MSRRPVEFWQIFFLAYTITLFGLTKLNHNLNIGVGAPDWSVDANLVNSLSINLSPDRMLWTRQFDPGNSEIYRRQICHRIPTLC